MRYVKTDYYDDFRCVAGDCPATCCGSWKILIDKEMLGKYASLTGDLGAQIKNGIDWTNECFLPREDGCCKMLRADGLCTIQRAMGEEMLCRTCDRYPRHEEEFENVREWSLSVSCPEAARMILGKGTKTSFVSWDDDLEEEYSYDDEDYDPMMFSMLEDAREVLIAIAQNDALSLEARAYEICAFAGKLQDICDEDGIFAADERIQEWNEHRGSIEVESLKDIMTEDLAKAWLEQLYELELLRDDWEETLDDAMAVLFGSEGIYDRIKCSFDEFEHAGGENAERLCRAQEEILVTFLFAYFCGAVYDGYIYSKAVLAVYSFVCIRLIAMAAWAKARDAFDMDELVRITYHYAREIEHSDVNLGVLMEWLDTQRI